jgi:hypothetical protein
MRKYSLTRLVQCEDLIVQTFGAVGKLTGPQISTRSNGVVDASCASHSARRTSATASTILFE